MIQPQEGESWDVSRDARPPCLLHNPSSYASSPIFYTSQRLQLHTKAKLMPQHEMAILVADGDNIEIFFFPVYGIYEEEEMFEC